MFLLRLQRGRLRSFFWGTVFVSVMAIISTVFYGRQRKLEDPRTISETVISQQAPGDSDSQALPRRYESSGRNHVVETLRDCHPRNNFIFIKIQKTGSSTVTNLLQRYAIDRELTVMVPTCTMCALSWPTSPERGMYLDSKSGRYNAIVHHTRYNKTWMESMFPSDTAYVTVIREPFCHLKSVFNYYHLSGKLFQRKKKRSGDENPIQLFLKSPFEHRYVLGYKHCEVTFERTRNFQAFDLGYKLEWADNAGKAERFLTDLERDFTLVMVLEHFDESLVLLRRLMCLEIKDILYDNSRPKKERSYAYKDYKPSEEERANHKEFNKVDYMLYEYFNKSLWNKITSEGPAFFAELEYYKQLNDNISKHCSDRQSKKEKLFVPSSKWNDGFHVSDEFCYRLRTKRTKNLDGRLRAHLVKSERKHVFGRCLPRDQYVVLKSNTRTP